MEVRTEGQHAQEDSEEIRDSTLAEGAAGGLRIGGIDAREPMVLNGESDAGSSESDQESEESRAATHKSNKRKEKNGLEEERVLEAWLCGQVSSFQKVLKP